MHTVAAPYLPFTTIGWTAVQLFTAHGLHFELRTNDASAMDALSAAVPFGWHAASPGEVDSVYALHMAQPSEEAPSEHRLYCDSSLVACTPDLDALLTAFTRHAELLTAERARDVLFVHAGVVGWQGKAIVIPGRSFSGKTTLVKALVEAGATYYSDEFAILDRGGLVHPYPLPISLRDTQGQSVGKVSVTSFGGQAGTQPLPVGLIAITQYEADSTWRPRSLSSAQALLALMNNTVAARREPAHSMPILREAVLHATCIQSKRGEASRVAQAIL